MSEIEKQTFHSGDRVSNGYSNGTVAGTIYWDGDLQYHILWDDVGIDTPVWSEGIHAIKE